MDLDFSSETALWKAIERSESHLVCSMFEDSSHVASSVLVFLLKRLSDDRYPENMEVLHEMTESAAMVLVQSWKELGRTSELLAELEKLFVPFSSIPVSVLIASVCFQLEDGSYGVQGFLESFLHEWRYLNGNYFSRFDVEDQYCQFKDCEGYFFLSVEKYMEVVELYVIRVLGMVLKDIDYGVQWVKNSALPEDLRQHLLLRLHTLDSIEDLESSKGQKKCSENFVERPFEIEHGPNLCDGQKNVKCSLQRWCLCFWWLRVIPLNFSTKRAIISSLILIIYVVMRRKQTSFKRTGRSAVTWVKSALADAWKLAFTFESSPLASVI